VPAAERRPPLASLVRADGSVVIPRGVAREVLRLLIIGLEVRVRADGGELAPLVRQLLWDLHAASAQADPGERPSGSGTGTVQPQKGRLALSVAQAAVTLGCSTRWVRRLLVGGRLTGHRVGVRAWAIDPDSLDQFRFNGGQHDHEDEHHGSARTAGRAG
jgi:excisionase family DNA binding protein